MTDELRHSAKTLKKTHSPFEELAEGEDVSKIIGQLQLHQSELIQQNEELRRIQHELEQAHEKYFNIYHHAPIGYFTLDQDGAILDINLTGAELLGHDRTSLLGKPLSLYLPRESHEIFYIHRQELFQSRMAQTCELTLYRSDGSLFYVQMKSTLDQNKDHLLSAVIDITERKQVEETIQRRNSELELINQAGQLFSSSLDIDQVLTTILEEVRNLLGIVGCSIWLVDPETNELVCRQATGLQHELVKNWRLKPGEGIAGWVARNNQSLIVPDTAADTRHFNNLNRQAGLEIRSIVSVPLQVKDKVIGALHAVDAPANRFTANDLKLMESMAPAAAIAIENAQLYAEQKQAEAELQTRNEELDAFAHTVAHDLKNPLGVMVGIAEILASDYDSIPLDDVKSYLATIAQSGRKARNIVEELLLLASVRRKEVELASLDMSRTIAEARQRLTDIITKSEATIVSPDQWPSALGYAPWIEEVWVNYLSNAIKYGGRPPEIELGATVQENNTVHFWIRDNGAGLAGQDQSQLFIPFTQLSQIRATGHGLGLSIVRRIIEKLGGQVTVQSEPGQGATFGFILPYASKKEM